MAMFGAVGIATLGTAIAMGGMVAMAAMVGVAMVGMAMVGRIGASRLELSHSVMLQLNTTLATVPTGLTTNTVYSSGIAITNDNIFAG